MSITAVSSVSNPHNYQATAAKQPVQQKNAPDGDSAAVEAAESRATKVAEKMNNGFAPKATTGFHKIA